MRHAAVVVAVLSTGFLPAAVFAQQVGDKIVVTADNAQLRANDATTGSVPKGNILVVKNVNGDWFWVIYSGGDGTLKGWINHSDVTPLSQALDFFSEELKRKPNAETYRLRALIWLEKGEYGIAIGDLEEAIRFNREHRPSTMALPDRSEKALPDSVLMFEIDPLDKEDRSNAPTYRSLGLAWAKKQEYEKAINNYDAAIRLDPNDALAYNNRGTTW
jgi:tetratricopeptide (TPR) repeat protein